MNFKRFICLAAFLTLGLSAHAKEVPPQPSISDGCPFECCSLGKWKVRPGSETVLLYDQPAGKKTVGRVKAGEEVTAVKGEVHLIPTKIVVLEKHRVKTAMAVGDSRDLKLKKGDVFYLMGHSPECGESYWYKGKVAENCLEDELVEKLRLCRGDKPSQDCWAKVEGERGGETWWVKVKTSAGVLGWTSDTSGFTGKDLCE